MRLMPAFFSAAKAEGKTGEPSGGKRVKVDINWYFGCR